MIWRSEGAMIKPATDRKDAARRGEAGFSLLEIMIALAILALSVALVGAAFGRSSVGFRFDAAAQELALSLREAQARALRSGRDVALVIDVDTRLYRLQEDPEVQLPEGIALNVMSAGEVMASSRRPVISFAPDGGSTGGAIRLSLEDRSTTISIDWLTGAVTTASGGVNAPQT
jgi:general secretion pathway protein H